MNNDVRSDTQEQSDQKRIAYQNKDIASKYFAEEYKDTLFKASGLNLPNIVAVEPTELPTVEVNNMAMDNLFLLADGSYAIIDYESEYKEENKVKYLGYIARVFKREYNKTRKIPKIRLVIVYTADVRKGSTKSVLDLFSVKLTIEEAFLSEMDAESILSICEEAIKQKKVLQPLEKLRLMLCPLSEKGRKAKRVTLRRVIELVKDLEDDKDLKQILSGMIAFTDKIISQKDAEEIRRILNMTKVGRIIYEEQLAAINNEVRRIAENLLSDGASNEYVNRITGLEMSVVEELAKKVAEQRASLATTV